MSGIGVMALGFLAQGFFSARIMVQWILSERARHVLSPALFWVFSLVGAYLLCIYGWMREDLAIVTGQLISYYIYIWNLRIKNLWERIPALLRWILLLTPVVATVMVAVNVTDLSARFFHDSGIPLWLLAYGMAGQLLFTLRFVYQLIYSRRMMESELPETFWTISLAGSLLIVSYAVMRRDVVLTVGQSVGIVAYVRNLMILRKDKQRSRG